MLYSLFINIIFTMFFMPTERLNSASNKIPNNIKLSINQSKKHPVKLKKTTEGDGYYVSVSRAYFYTQPSHEYINTKKFLIRGDYCEVLRYKNGFGYVNYYNTNNYKTTSGWLDINNLSSVYDH